MNGLELKWTGEGDGLRLSLSVPGVSALYPVADLIEMLKANPEACAEVMRGLDENYDRSIGVVVRRAESAERERDALRELIHTESGLDDHRYSAEQMVKEMAERWQGASDDCEKAEQALATMTAERDEALRVSEARRADLTLLRRLVMGGVGLLTTGEGKETWAAIRVLEEDRDALKAKLAEAERKLAAAQRFPKGFV